MNKKDPDMNPDTSEPSAERQAFEKWGSDYFNYGFKPETWLPLEQEYTHEGTQMAWDGWQARAGAKESQPVAWTLTETLRNRQSTTRANLWFTDPQNTSWTPLYTHSRAEAPPVLKRVGWLRSDEEDRYRNFLRDEMHERFDDSGYDTPVFVQLYTKEELDEAAERGRSLAEAIRSDEKESAQEKSVQPADERQARALEFAEYLAKGAEQFIDAINEQARLGLKIEDGEPVTGAIVDAADEAVTEYMRGLRSDIYEFRKRAARAAIAPTKEQTNE